MRILVTGGVRSGKSRYAQQRAEALGPQRIYLATAEAGDAEMEDRITQHRQDRGTGWSTCEETLHIANKLDMGPVVLLDCLTLWLSNLLMTGIDDTKIAAACDELCVTLRRCTNDVVLVTNEVGLGIVPSSALGRRFRDLAGRLSQRVAAECDEVVLICSGLPLVLKSIDLPAGAHRPRP